MYQAEIDFYDNMCICLLGPCEVEISYGGEADLHQHYSACEKNPGHLKFVPVDQFIMSQLSLHYREKDLWKYIRTLSYLTVRVSVKNVSDYRLKTTPDTKKPFPCYSGTGSDMMRVGTGWVDWVVKFPNKYSKNKACTCRECIWSPRPQEQYAHILIRTSAHLVYDSEEGENTTCHLFFDRGDTPDACPSAVALSGMSNVESSIERDRCQMTYVTHDMSLANKLRKAVRSLNRLRECLSYEGRWDVLCCVPEPENTLAVIVSHPHGCSKQVSIGQCFSRDKVKEGFSTYTYTAATCPGSSGAHVIALRKDVFSYDHAHFGKCKQNENSYSGHGVDLYLTA